MTFHGSGIDEETYDALRGYMFGGYLMDEWVKDLDKPEEFIDWVINECPWGSDFPDMSEEEVRALARRVFDHKVEEWRQEQEEASE